MPARSHTCHNLPYKEHPLYHLRRATIIAAVISGILDLFITIYGPWAISIFLLPCSALFVIYDLITWAVEKKKVALLNAYAKYQRIIGNLPPPGCSIAGCERGESQQPFRDVEGVCERCDSLAGNAEGDTEGDREVHWPRILLIVADGIFAILFQFLFWVCIVSAANSGWRYGPQGRLIVQSYAALGSFVMSVLHVVAFWKELIAKLHARWREEERRRVRTHTDTPVDIPIQDVDTTNRKSGATANKWRMFRFDKQQRSSKPKQQDVDVEAVAGCGTNEEELLINPTPEESVQGSSQDYGVIDANIQSPESEPEAWVKKSKGKRVVG